MTSDDCADRRAPRPKISPSYGRAENATVERAAVHGSGVAEWVVLVQQQEARLNEMEPLDARTGGDYEAQSGSLPNCPPAAL